MQVFKNNTGSTAILYLLNILTNIFSIPIVAFKGEKELQKIAFFLENVNEREI